MYYSTIDGMVKEGAEMKVLKIDRPMAGGFGCLTAPTGLRVADCPAGNEVLYTAFRRHRLTLFTFPLARKAGAGKSEVRSLMSSPSIISFGNTAMQ